MNTAKNILFISRNKDNKDIPGFKQRSMSFLSTEDETSLLQKFDTFCKQGLPGEVSRFYVSINERNMEKVNRSLIKYLLDNPDFDLSKIDQKIASIAGLSENAVTKYWLFDFDSAKVEDISDFLKDLMKYAGNLYPDGPYKNYEIHPTKNGYAIITMTHFDTRELLEKWKNIVELKRDDMLLLKWQENKAYNKEINSNDLENEDNDYEK